MTVKLNTKDGHFHFRGSRTEIRNSFGAPVTFRHLAGPDFLLPTWFKVDKYEVSANTDGDRDDYNDEAWIRGHGTWPGY